MIRAFFIIVLLPLCNKGISQPNQNYIDSLFKSARDQIDDSLYDQALATYQSIIINSAPNSTPYAKAVYNSGWVYLLANKIDSAKKIFQEILISQFNEMDKGGKGGGIMGDPYALYKHNSCENLARIEMENKNFKEALKYIKLFDKKYPYKHFCGNELKSYSIFRAQMYAEVYLGLKDSVKALDHLLPEIFDSGLASNAELVQTTTALLKIIYSHKELDSGMEKALASISIRTYKNRKYRYDRVKIVFLKRTIEVPDFDPDYYNSKTDNSKLTKIEKMKLLIQHSEFYKQLGL